MLGGLVMAARENKSGFDDRLVELFRNRAQLKKAHQALQQEFHSLEEKLKNAEASTRRAEERLEAIERLMAKPEAGYNGLVYFQLRSLWRACFDQLGVFAEELRKQQEDRERKKQLQNFNKDRAHRMDEINDLIRRVKDEADEIAGEIGELESRESRLRGFWNYFRRREIAARLGERKSEHASARTRIEELFDRRIKIESEPRPEFPGLSVEGRRIVNIAVIAYAQHLYAYFSEGNIARLAREAVTRPIQDLKYGSEKDCTHLIDKIQQLTLGLKDSHLKAEGLKEMALEIRRHAEFRNGEDTVPAASSLDGMLTGSVLAGPRTNVLMDEYWDIYEVFLR
jgi:uncharacterized protein YukE